MALLKILMMSCATAALILDSPAACAAGAEGIQLCLKVVVPSLFPFMFLSMLLVSSMGTFRFRILDPVCKLCRMPVGSEGLLALGLLGGYPTGAQAVNLSHERKVLSDDTARRMLVICNNCGPAFLFGMVGRSFSDSWAVWKIWGITILGALITAILLPGDGGTIKNLPNNKNDSAVKLMDRAIRALARICGWVILFRVVLAFADRWFLWMLPSWPRVLICGLTELTNGCMALPQITDEGLRFVLSCGMLSFGGLCVWMQTMSVIHPSLDKRLYFPGKVLHGCISTLLAWLFCPVGWEIPLIASLTAVIAMLFLRKCVKRSRFSEKVGV